MSNPLRGHPQRRVTTSTTTPHQPRVLSSKKFGSWESNLLTEWHQRYGGPGVMIDWHVERQHTCIYSQLKSCSSSEVAAMIEGLLRHCSITPGANLADGVSVHVSDEFWTRRPSNRVPPGLP